MVRIIDRTEPPFKKKKRNRVGGSQAYAQSPCRAVGCPKGTFHKKPYCFEHVHLMPYVAKLLWNDQQRIEEAKRISVKEEKFPGLGWKIINLDGPRCRDVINVIQNAENSEMGYATFERISTELTCGLTSFPVKMVMIYIKALEVARLIKVVTIRVRTIWMKIPLYLPLEEQVRPSRKRKLRVKHFRKPASIERISDTAAA